MRNKCWVHSRVSSSAFLHSRTWITLPDSCICTIDAAEMNAHECSAMRVHFKILWTFLRLEVASFLRCSWKYLRICIISLPFYLFIKLRAHEWKAIFSRFFPLFARPWNTWQIYHTASLLLASLAHLNSISFHAVAFNQFTIEILMERKKRWSEQAQMKTKPIRCQGFLAASDWSLVKKSVNKLTQRLGCRSCLPKKKSS